MRSKVVVCCFSPPLSDSLTLAAVGVEVRYGGQGLFMVVCLDFVDIVPIHEEEKKKFESITEILVVIMMVDFPPRSKFGRVRCLAPLASHAV